MTVAWFLTTSQGAATRRSTALASPEPRMAYFPGMQVRYAHRLGRPDETTAGLPCLLHGLHTLGFPIERIRHGVWLYARFGLRAQASDKWRCLGVHRAL